MDQVANLLDRPRLYYNIDGLGEVGTGFMTLGYALLMYLQTHTPANAVWHKMWAFFVYVGVMVAVIHYGTTAIKKRITYPRTGFVAYRTRDHWRMGTIAAIAAAGVSAALIIALQRHWDISTLVLLFGPFLATIYAYRFTRTVRWKWIVVAAMLLGTVVIAYLPESAVAALANDSFITHPVRTRAFGTFLATIILYGAVLMVSGAVSFWHYLRHTQAPAQESQ